MGSRLSSRVHRVAVLAVAIAYTARALAFITMARPGFSYPGNGTPNPFLLTKTYEEFLHLKEHWAEYKKAHNIA